MHACQLRGGIVGFACLRGGGKKCRYCGTSGDKLCDWDLTGPKEGKTCDIPMCTRCAYHIDPDKDYCRPHAELVRGYRKVVEDAGAAFIGVGTGMVYFDDPKATHGSTMCLFFEGLTFEAVRLKMEDKCRQVENLKATKV